MIRPSAGDSFRQRFGAIPLGVATSVDSRDEKTRAINRDKIVIKITLLFLWWQPVM